MAQFRCASLIALTLAGCQAHGQATHSSPRPGIVLELGKVPGGLTIANTSSGPLIIERAIAVQQRTNAGWRPIITEFNAVSECRPEPSTAPVRLEPAARIAIAPWQGYSCSGQCEATCRGNISYAPGTYRFVVKVLPDRIDVVSSSFDLPATRP